MSLNRRRGSQQETSSSLTLVLVFQTADIILRNNLHSSDVEIVSDPLLKERVSENQVFFMAAVLGLGPVTGQGGIGEGVNLKHGMLFLWSPALY